VATHPCSKAGGSFLLAVSAAQGTLSHGTFNFYKWGLVAEKPQFFSLADTPAVLDIFADIACLNLWPKTGF
jgi:hypothetical protein